MSLSICCTHREPLVYCACIWTCRPQKCRICNLGLSSIVQPVFSVWNLESSSPLWHHQPSCYINLHLFAGVGRCKHAVLCIMSKKVKLQQFISPPQQRSPMTTWYYWCYWALLSMLPSYQLKQMKWRLSCFFTWGCGGGFFSLLPNNTHHQTTCCKRCHISWRCFS